MNMIYDPMETARLKAASRTATGQQVAGAIGQGLTAAGQLVDAYQQAKNNWGVMETAYKAVKQTYRNYSQPLIDAGIMTPEDQARRMSQFTFPSEIHKKNPEGYVKVLGDITQGLFKEVDSMLTDYKKKTEGIERNREVAGTALGYLQGQQQPQTGQQPQVEQQQYGQQPVQPIQQPEGLPEGLGTEAFERGEMPQQPIQQPQTGQPTQAEQPTQVEQPAQPLTAEGLQKHMLEKTMGSKSGPVTREETEKFAKLPSEMDMLKQQRLDEHRKRMVAKGLDKEKIDIATNNLDIVFKRQDKVNKEILDREKEQRLLVGLQQRIKKGDQLSVEDQLLMNDFGISLSLSNDEKEQVLEGIKDGIIAEIRIEKKKKSVLQKAYEEILENPSASIFKTLKAGEEGYIAPPIPYGGTKEGYSDVGTSGGSQQKIPVATPIPTRQKTPIIPKDTIQKNIWDSLMSKVRSGKMSQEVAEEYFRSKFGQ